MSFQTPLSEPIWNLKSTLSNSPPTHISELYLCHVWGQNCTLGGEQRFLLQLPW